MIPGLNFFDINSLDVFLFVIFLPVILLPVILLPVSLCPPLPLSLFLAIHPSTWIGGGVDSFVKREQARSMCLLLVCLIRELFPIVKYLCL